MISMRNLLYLQLLSVGILCCLLQVSTAADTLSSAQSLSDEDGQTLVSAGGRFKLGFFSPGNSTNRYVGIWFNNIPDITVVWVANRANPINGTYGVLMVSNVTGNLVIMSHNGTVDVWSSNSTKAENPVAQLLDSGNLVLTDDANNPNLYLWQSFDYPLDKLLAEMKLGWDLRKGLNRRLSAWKSPEDPSPGHLSMQLENPYPELMMRSDSQKLARSGPWNGLKLSGGRMLQPNSLYTYDFILNEDEAYYIYHLKNSSTITMMVLNETTTKYARYIWMEDKQKWHSTINIPADLCDTYASCGHNGICSISKSPACQCLQGFEALSPTDWQSQEWSKGCVRATPLNCTTSLNDEFVRLTGLKLPETTYTWLNQSMNLEECKAKCLQNCSCTAYTNSDIRGQGTGCAIWFGDLIDTRELPANGQDLYVRMPPSKSGDWNDIKSVIVIVVAVVLAVFVLTLIVGCYVHKRRRVPRESTMHKESEHPKEGNDLELPMFDLATVVKATHNFSTQNKIGEGGFGPVYKGVLEDGQEIAVKRLSRSSGQGQTEFKNEVILIAKLQHRNLVKMLGCCFEGTEKMLVYEYMPNKSLDQFIFDPTRRGLIDWAHRFRIICGIARGLLYLHQDSRLRIIHRDLKASNVLLDKEMNPKISDFGMARTFGGDQTEGNTNRVVGTYGYMAPEYAINGIFSIKSDVFSFGILTLEIVTGKKNRGIYRRDRSLNLIGYAWEHWKDGIPLGLIDEFLIDSINSTEVLRCIHIALLCAQQRPEDRPSMPSVVLMLGSENELPQPKQPAFFDNSDRFVALETSEFFSSSKQESYSTNEVTMTLLKAR